MNIHEYQAKQLLSKYAIPVPAGAIASSAEEAKRLAADLGGSSWAVKAQIHAGDRAQAGGVQVADSVAAVEQIARELLGKRLVTSQTGHQGIKVAKVYIEQACDISRELYVGLLVDRSRARVTLLASKQGGTAIEELVSADPDRVMRVPIEAKAGLSDAQARSLSDALGLDGELASAAQRLMHGLYQAFIELDASLIEVNPLIVTSGNELVALDAKMSVDDNALFRHEELQALRDDEENDPERLERERHGFNYIGLDGDIGCVVTGAGLALATMDIIKLHGGQPANFLDLPPVATRVEIAAATKRVIADPRVKAVLVNAVGGGITRCDVIAEGVATAAREVSIKVPVVIRFAGTSKEMGLMLLKNTRLKVITADDLDEAARSVVTAAKAAA